MYTDEELALNTAYNQQVAEQLVVVLVETSHPANIGAAARAMKTMGVTKLRLVNPDDFPSARANWLASGATDVLDNAQIFETFDQAIADCNLVIGTSARLRTLPWPNLSPQAVAVEAMQKTRQGNQVALVFGREARGLTNEELRACQIHTMIPSNPDYGILNISQAVQVLCYQMRLSFIQHQNETNLKPQQMCT